MGAFPQKSPDNVPEHGCRGLKAPSRNNRATPSLLEIICRTLDMYVFFSKREEDQIVRVLKEGPDKENLNCLEISGGNLKELGYCSLY